MAGSTVGCIDRITGHNDISRIAALVAALGVKDPYSSQHSRRVSWLARNLANLIQLPKEEEYVACLGGLLHDLGKIVISDEVLSKPAALTASEWDEIRSHPTAGALILRAANFSEKVISVVWHHHEDFNGSGYPDGLSGEEIPLPARIVRVADTFDALTTDRPYRQSYSASDALRLLEVGAWSAFDPVVVSAMVRLVRATNFHMAVDNDCPIFRNRGDLFRLKG